jgi:Mrp family chromosome partitioning ATPase
VTLRDRSLLDDSLRWYLEVPWRRMPAVLAAVGIVLLVAAFTALRQPAVYEATARVLLGRQDAAASLTGTPDPVAAQDATRLSQTMAAVARTEPVLALAERLGRTGGDPLRHSMVTAKDGTDLLEFRVRSRDPAVAQRAARAYAAAFVRYRRDLDLQAEGAAARGVNLRLQRLRAAHAQRSRLYKRLVGESQKLRTLEALQTADALAIGGAPQTQQVEPKPLRTVMLALAVGLLLGLALAFAWERLDRRRYAEPPPGERLRLPVLARLPEPIGGDGRPAMLSAPAGDEAEAYRLLRTSLELANRLSGARSVMVTSTGEEGEKSCCAANLALAFARAGRRVVLVDLSVRAPALHRLLGIAARPGAIDVVLGKAPLERSLRCVALSAPSLERGGANGRGTVAGMLEVLVLGEPHDDPGELAASVAIADLLAELTDRADLVLVDGPPLLPGSDGLALSASVDALLVVSRAEALDGAMADELDRALKLSPSRPLGLAVIECAPQRPAARAPTGRVPTARREPVA